ncbi:MAG: ABC transporter permease/substrate-binding protein, partial [Clostridium sp.]
MTTFIETLTSNGNQIFTLFFQHIGLTVLAVLLAVLIGVPTGIFITKSEKLSKPILMLANVVQAVPSLALLGFLIPVIGIGSTPAIIMVVLYSLLPIIKNTYTGLSSISPDAIECARGMGLTKNQILRLIKLPLAMPIIMAGVRIAAVTAVGLMTIAAFIGAGGLGYLVFSGIQTVNNNLILSGAIPAAILALLIDFIVGKIENSVTPNGFKDAKGNVRRRKKLKCPKKLTMVVCLILGVTLIGGYFAFRPSNKDTITIASKNYTEQLILGNMYSDLIESHTDLNVERKMNLGGTDVAFSALTSGEIDMYVEYTGTYYCNILNLNPLNRDPNIYDFVKKSAHDKYDLTFFKPIGFNNSYGIGIKKEFAESNGIKTISDLAKYSKDLIISPTIEFCNRDD